MSNLTYEGRVLTPVGDLKPLLKGAFPAFVRLVGYIRVHYVMDELWDYHEKQLKFRRGGKTLVAIAVKDGLFNVLVIFGKAERAAFDAAWEQFSDFLRAHYDNSSTYHDGKWMFIDIADEAQLDDLLRFIAIKKKPNRKAAALALGEMPCGNRCGQCLIYIKNNEGGRRDNLIFHEMDWKAYHDDSEERPDHSSTTCPGCAARKLKGECHTHRCLDEKGLASCLQCHYEGCVTKGVGVNPGLCNLGLTAEDVTGVLLPYCGKERFDWLKTNAVPL